MSHVCFSCRHRDPTKSRSCDAFPNGIPDAIWRGEHQHRTPYPGDGGIMYKPMNDDDRARRIAQIDRFLRQT